MRSTFLLIAVVLAGACSPSPRPPITPDDGQLGPAVTAQPTTGAQSNQPTDGATSPGATEGAAGGDSYGSGDDPSDEPGGGGTVDGGEVEAPPVSPRPAN